MFFSDLFFQENCLLKNLTVTIMSCLGNYDMIFRKFHLDKLITVFQTIIFTELLIEKSLKFSQSFKQYFTFTGLNLVLP